MTPAEIQRLRAEVRSDRAAFEERLDELASLDGSDGSPAALAQRAVALHHAYGAVEAALARVARQLEGSAPQGSDWHQALLHAMTLEIPTVRPAVVGADTAAHLRKLLAFRHFFRHAYAASWDLEQLTQLGEEARLVRGPLARDLDALDAFLAGLAGALEP